METWREAKILGYDTVVAVTQNNINSHFKRIFGSPGGIQREISIGNKRLGLLKSTIAAPTVWLRTGTEKNTVSFVIRLLKGELQYYKGDADELSTQAINDWKLSFKVNLDIAKVEQSSLPGPVMDAVKRRLPSGAIDPAMLSYRHLFMYFENVAAMESWEATFPEDVADPKDHRRLADHAVEEALLLLMTKYLSQLSAVGHHTLGYAIIVENPNQFEQRIPTFPPTDIAFAVNSFEGGGNEDGGIDTLCSSMRTDKRTLPKMNPPQRFGNWVTDRSEYGVIAVAKSLFLDRYILPELAKELTLQSEFTLSNPKANSHVEYTNSLQTRYGGGKLESAPGTYSYHYGSDKSIDLFGTLYTQEHKWSISHDIGVSIPAGGNVIEVKGSTKIRADCIHWHGWKNNAAPTLWWREMKTNWGLTIK